MAEEAWESAWLHGRPTLVEAPRDGGRGIAVEDRSTEQRIQDLLSQMTLQEKVAMTVGSGLWHSTGVERLVIPPFRFTNGPNGARGNGRSGATSA